MYIGYVRIARRNQTQNQGDFRVVVVYSITRVSLPGNKEGEAECAAKNSRAEKGSLTIRSLQYREG